MENKNTEHYHGCSQHKSTKTTAAQLDNWQLLKTWGFIAVSRFYWDFQVLLGFGGYVGVLGLYWSFYMDQNLRILRVLLEPEPPVRSHHKSI